MAIKFTETQQRVIDTRGCNLLISAAAGSGKTAVLVERIVKMVCDAEHPVDIDRLLVVTFTNAAAAQMRERISLALNERLSQDPENEHLQRQTTLLYNAQITTIDSFCLFVLRNQFHTIGLDPGFRIAEEGEMKLLREDVLAQVIEDAYAKAEPDFLHCMEYFSAGSRDEAVEKEVLKLYDFAMSMPFPEQWLRARKSDYGLNRTETASGGSGSGDFWALSWAADLLTHVRLVLAGCMEKLEAALHLCEEPDGPYPYAALLERESEMVEKLLLACGGSRDNEVTAEKAAEKIEEAVAPDYDALCAAFGAVQFERLPAKRDDAISPAKREMAKGLRDEVKGILSELRTQFFAGSTKQVERQMAACGRAVEALVDLTLAFKEAFDGAKREKNILDFDDIEHFALQVLVKEEEGKCVPTETASAYRDCFAEILIDEYQDSNLVQEYLLSCISGEAVGRHNRFMVGDVKQSIYKFRLARPELFLEKYETYGQGGGESLRIDLHQNFRSRREVLDSVNGLFERLMGQEAGGIVYDEQAALHLGADYPENGSKGMDDSQAENDSQADSPNRTELLLFQTQDAPEEVSVKEQEAYGVAARIKELLRTFQVTDRETGRLRKASYRDIVILLRTVSGWDEVFKKVLEQEGIPVHVTSRTGYFAATEVQELLHFLRILDNPLQDIPLYGVLHSWLGGFSEEEIALVRAACPKKRYLYDALCACGADTALSDKISVFLQKISRYRDLAAYLSVHELLQTILRESGYLHYVAARSEGSRRRANVEMLLVKAADYEKTSYFGLYHFLRYMEQLEKYEVDYGEAAMQDENADVVRIMSIHKSKGLEFPICFVAGLAKGFQKREATGVLAVDVDMGIGVDYVDPKGRVKAKNLRKNAVAVKLKRDNLAEELRILYVAMTRAEEKLILTGVVKNPEKRAAYLASCRRRKRKLLSYEVLLGQDSLLGLVMAALSGNRCLDGFYESCGMEADPNSPEYAQNLAVAVKLTGWDHVMEEKLTETVLSVDAKRRLLLSDPEKEVDAELMTKMSYRFSHTYPHENLRELYTKTTVSELKKAGMQEETDVSVKLYEEKPVVPYLPKFIENDERVTGSMRGSAFHKVMELLDFRELTEEVSADRRLAEAMLRSQLDRMEQEGRLSAAYREVVSVEKLTAFLTSRVALRMADAARAGRLYREQPFVMGLPASRLKDSFPAEETVLIQGIIDVFFEEEDGYVLLDYKTDAVSAPEELVKRYRVQLDYYSEALEQIFGDTAGGGKPVKERILYSFKLGEEIQVVPPRDGRTVIPL
ncbi:MAG: helicase-exonuclease AddAB subunit AddA [Lachnospiraceae bacterium]|nr:helicase-exonuclease AddAB subunit AddA [Lachnospiraceae bacterium]